MCRFRSLELMYLLLLLWLWSQLQVDQWFSGPPYLKVSGSPRWCSPGGAALIYPSPAHLLSLVESYSPHLKKKQSRKAQAKWTNQTRQQIQTVRLQFLLVKILKNDSHLSPRLILALPGGVCSLLQSSSADRWLQFKCPQPKRTREIFNEKICPFRKRRALGRTQEAICKLTAEQRKGKEMEHLLLIWSSGEFDASTLTLAIFAGSRQSSQSQSKEQR